MVCPGPLVASIGTVAGLDLAYIYRVYGRPAEGPFELNIRLVERLRWCRGSVLIFSTRPKPSDF